MNHGPVKNLVAAESNEPISLGIGPLATTGPCRAVGQWFGRHPCRRPQSMYAVKEFLVFRIAFALARRHKAAPRFLVGTDSRASGCVRAALVGSSYRADCSRRGALATFRIALKYSDQLAALRWG